MKSTSFKRRGGITATVLVLGLLLAPAAPAAPPTITHPTVTDVTTTSATLQGDLNPGDKATAYHFEYGTLPCSADPCLKSPEPDATIPKGLLTVGVSTSITGLAPATTYYFRLIAKNGDAPTGVEGPERTFTTRPIPPPFGPCPNDAFRTNEPSAALPDCRAYEQASPVNKNGLDALGRLAYLKASPDGDRIGFVSSNGLPGGDGAQDLPTYLATRGESNWSTQGMLPPASLGGEGLVLGWTPDFSHLFGYAGPFSSPGGTLVQRSTADGSLTTIVAPGGDLSRGVAYAGSSADGSLVFFESVDKLLPEALADKPNLYVWNRESGQLHLAGALDDGSSPPEGAFAGPYDWLLTPTLPLTARFGGSSTNYYTQDLHAISDDGSVYFTAAKTGQLYLRADPAGPGATTHVSASKRTPPDPLGSRPAAFMAATPDGSRAFFASPEELTNDANTGPDQPPPAIGSAELSTEPPTIEPEIPSIVAGAIATDSTYIYWVNTAAGTIGRVKLNGDEPQPDFITVPPLSVCPSEKTCPPDQEEEVEAKPQYVAVDDDHIYWTNAGEGETHEGTIGRADLDGDPENIDVEWITGASNPRGIALDAGHIYWANASKDQAIRGIGRAGIGGSGVNQRFIPGTGGERPEGIAVDASHIYWTTNELNGNTIFGNFLRADLPDGTNVVGKFLGTNAEPRGIAVDSGYLYWASKGDEAIGRMPLGGFSEPAHCPVLISCEPKFIDLGARPKGLTLDDSHLYWSQNGEAVPNPGNDLYLHERETGALTDLTPDADDTNGAEVKGVLGISEDGKRLYLAANGGLDDVGPPQAGNCKGSGESFSGLCGLYLLEESSPGTWSTRFITTLDANGSSERTDAVNWFARGAGTWPYEKSAFTSADGSVLVFRSQQKLTDYDNEGVPQFYRYDADADQITCLTCNPSGEAPQGRFGGVGAPHLGSINLDFLVPIDPAFTLSRSLSADGDRFFFESSDALIGADTNGSDGCEVVAFSSTNRQSSCQDVYEWEAQGSGSCNEDLQGGGCLYLLSTGTSPDPSYFADASTDGDTAFLITRPPLVPQDRDDLFDVYAARVDGGLAAQNQPPPPPPCEEEGCKGPSSEPPGFFSLATPAFTGPSDRKPTRCPARKVRKRGKCATKAKKNRKKHHHKRHHHNPTRDGRAGR